MLQYMSRQVGRPMAGIEKRLYTLAGNAKSGTEEERPRDDENESHNEAESEPEHSNCRPSSGPCYSAQEDALLCRTYERYRSSGKTKQCCLEAVAAETGRSVVSVNQRVLRLRAAGELPRWDGSMHAPQLETDSAVVDGDSASDCGSAGSRHSLYEATDGKAALGRRQVRDNSSSDDSLHNTDSDSCAHRPSLSQRTIGHSPALRAGPGPRNELQPSLGKRSWSDKKASSFKQQSWSLVSSSNSLQDLNDQRPEHSRDENIAFSAPAPRKKTKLKGRFTPDEDAILRQAYQKLPADADVDQRWELNRRLADRLSRTAAVVQQRARLLGYVDYGRCSAARSNSPASAAITSAAPRVTSSAGGFTPEEDAIIWEAHTQHRTETTSSSAAAGGAGYRAGVLGYVSELAELLGRSYTQVQRQLDRLRAQDQATPRTKPLFMLLFSSTR